MKKLILILFCAGVAYNAGAQNIKDISTANFYGIDFSATKIFGAAESDAQFYAVFEEINLLILKEHKKYNVEKTFRKTFPVQNVDTAIKRSKIDRDLRTDDKTYRVSEAEVRDIVTAYGNNAGSGTGMVVIAELFDKQNNRGWYKVVFFDLASHEVIYMKEVSGKAKGFGLRNFWAGSFYEVLKGWKY